MEIHPPTNPVESVKDFLIHLSMITIGILIALGLEQAVEAWHHHELGVEARENILNEIRDNKKEIDGARILIKKNQQELQHTQSLLQRIQDEEFRMAANALAPIANTPGGPNGLSDDQLRGVERDVLSCMAGASMWDQIASQLSDQYGRVLKTQ